MSRREVNGWIITEHESARPVFVSENLHLPGGVGRYTALFFRIPAARRIEIHHHAGATAQDRSKSLIAGSLIARSKAPALPWTRRRMKNGHNWFFTVTLGTPIDEAEEFERLRRGLLTDGAVDLEFHSLIDQIQELAP